MEQLEHPGPNHPSSTHFKEDMDQAIKGKNISLVGIAIKEEERKRAEEVTAVVEKKKATSLPLWPPYFIVGGWQREDTRSM